jgi:hypothetical protein
LICPHPVKTLTPTLSQSTGRGRNAAVSGDGDKGCALHTVPPRGTIRWVPFV